MPRRLPAAASLLLLLAAVTGCGADPARPAPVTVRAHAVQPAPSGSVAPPNGVDLLFAKMMVAHHAQAVSMSTTLLAMRDIPERVANVAGFIEHDQQREINEMNQWLRAWGKPPVEPGDPLIAQLHGTGAGHGMLTGAQLAEISRAAPKAATELYLRHMIEHHLGAITMARSALQSGGNAYIRGLATHVVNEQSAENDAMRRLLEELG